jgi:DNA-binding transcriptional ArsR family regulator
MTNTDAVFSALADGTRRKIIEQLHVKDATLLELAEHFPMSFQGLSKHIKILEQANLLQKEKQGKYRILSLNRDVLRSPLEWISFYSSFWNGSFDKLDDLIRKVNTDAKPK